MPTIIMSTPDSSSAQHSAHRGFSLVLYGRGPVGSREDAIDDGTSAQGGSMQVLEAHTIQSHWPGALEAELWAPPFLGSCLAFSPLSTSQCAGLSSASNPHAHRGCSSSFFKGKIRPDSSSD